MADPTAAQRKMFGKMGIAMPDGSYYIRPDHPEDLTNAISAVGRATGSGGTTDEEQRNAVRRHIATRAKALKRTGEIPATWNPDGSLSHSAVENDDSIEHFGVKGMHWGVRRAHTHEELLAKVASHQQASKAHADLAKHYTAENADLEKNGVNSEPFKRVYGKFASQQSDREFYARNGQTKYQALEQVHNNLRMVNNYHANRANGHAKKAIKLQAKADAMNHSDLYLDPDSDQDQDLDLDLDALEHFGVKGMHWGVRKNRSTASSAPRAKSSTDAARAEKITTKAQAGGVHTLTNKELKDLVSRMQLEQQHSKLTTPEDAKRSKDGKNFVQKYNGHAATGITAFKTTKEIVKIVGPLLVAAAAGAAAAKAGSGSSGPVRMPQLAIGA